ncbi:MAG TPA: CARDB domain-containing protein [Thermomicrobiales bacterium]|nr:CARDB domain-containing protein [Thermomicrobiales bacterium]
MSVSLRRFVVLPALALALMIAAVGMSASRADAQEIRYPIGDWPVLELTGSDLVISNVSEGYSRAGWFTSITVRNDGNVSAGEFHVGFNNSYAYVPGLNVGASSTVRIYRGRSCEASGTIMADAFNEVYERNEGNNSRNWVVIC